MKNIITIIFLLVSVSVFGQNIGLNIGDKAPEISQKNPNGEIMNLSDLKGKIVLVDFWASWCGPCRRENPNVVKNYKSFKNKKFKNGNGLEVYSVSLDKNMKSWIIAMQRDQLIWEYHVSDLKGWESSAASKYNVSSIPSTFLIDGDGIIIAKNLKGKDLGQFLNEIKIN